MSYPVKLKDVKITDFLPLKIMVTIPTPPAFMSAATTEARAAMKGVTR